VLGSRRANLPGAIVSLAAVGAGFLGGGALLKRASTRSAASRSVNSIATCVRSPSRRASRSLSFVFSAVIWSNIVGAVVGIVTLSDFKLIGMVGPDGIYHRIARSSTLECSIDFVATDRRPAAVNASSRFEPLSDGLTADDGQAADGDFDAVPVFRPNQGTGSELRRIASYAALQISSTAQAFDLPVAAGELHAALVQHRTPIHSIGPTPCPDPGE
jgi:hypothetical protein